MINIEANIKQFCEILVDVLDESEASYLLKYLNKTDFFTAPASTRFHLAEKGGLCQHSLNVYTAAMQLDIVMKTGASKRSIAICSLLHDICKIDVYKTDYKNVKIYDEEVVKKANKHRVKQDRKGFFVWDVKEGYVFEDVWPFGHGSKSAYIASHLIPLTPEESLAIRFHMGPYEEGDKQNCSAVFEKSKLALLIHFADMYASKIMEGENET